MALGEFTARFTPMATRRPRAVNSPQYSSLQALLRRFLGLAFLACLVNGPAFAQGTVQDQIDFNTARADAVLGTSATPAGLPTFGSLVSSGAYIGASAGPGVPFTPVSTHQFNLNVLIPFSYDGANAESGTAGAGEVTPNVKGSFMVHPQNSPLEYSGFLEASSDRYSGSLRSKDSDKIDGALRVDYIGRDPLYDKDEVIPYLSYAPQQVYNPFFSDEKHFTQDFALGVAKLWDLNDKGMKEDARTSIAPTWEFGLQGFTQRRLVNNAPDSTAVEIGPSVKWSSTDEEAWPHKPYEQIGNLAASFAVNLTRRWYDKTGESTWTATPILTLAWVLPSTWFSSAAKFGKPELDFQVSYNDLSSTISANSSRQFAAALNFRAGWSR